MRTKHVQHVELAEFLSRNDFLHVLHSIEILFLPYKRDLRRKRSVH